MFKFKIFFSIIIFSFLLLGTSFIKNQTREIEKKIYSLNKKIYEKEKNFNETSLDFFYLTSPSAIENKIEILHINQYFPIEYSNIFLSMSDFLDIEKKIVNQENYNEKNIKKK